VLTEDDSLVDAALSEILALSLDKRRQRDPGGEVDYLLMQHHLGQVGLRPILSLLFVIFDSFFLCHLLLPG
jgi:superkiller protein 3